MMSMHSCHVSLPMLDDARAEGRLVGESRVAPDHLRRAMTARQGERGW
jgi:hypothetical protein